MKAAFYERDITPPLGGYLNGSYARIFAEDVLDNLFVRTCVIEEDGKYAVITEIDLCEMPQDLRPLVVARVREYTGLDEASIMLSANHTHKGIPVSDSPEINCFADETYKDVVYRLIADSIILAYRRVTEADAFFGEASAEGISFNRTFIAPDGKYRTHCPLGENWQSLDGVDESVPVLFVRDKNGAPMGAVVSFACHQDCTPDNQYSGAFSHVLSELMKERYGKSFVTVFLAGACGDINHVDPKLRELPSDTYIHMGRVLFGAVCEAVEKSSVAADGVDVRLERIKLKRRIPSNEEYAEMLRRYAHDDPHGFKLRNLLYYKDTVEGEDFEVVCQCFRVGDVAIYAYPGEIFVCYGLELKKRSPFSRNILGTLCNMYCGYVPSHAVFEARSETYETCLCHGACLEEGSGDILNDTLLSMAREIYPTAEK